MRNLNLWGEKPATHCVLQPEINELARRVSPKIRISRLVYCICNAPYRGKNVLDKYSGRWFWVLKLDRNKIYFVAETKSSLENDDLRRKEELRLKCGQAHFREFADVKYRTVRTFKDLIDPV